MFASHRRDKILELLRKMGLPKCLTFAKLFKVTEVTIRQDLEKLDKDGLIVRGAWWCIPEKYQRPGADFSLAHQSISTKGTYCREVCELY